MLGPAKSEDKTKFIIVMGRGWHLVVTVMHRTSEVGHSTLTAARAALAS